jgi:hypothetical protein
MNLNNSIYEQLDNWAWGLHSKIQYQLSDQLSYKLRDKGAKRLHIQLYRRLYIALCIELNK